jgi:MEDS: MEthanogen/methylotroph, DcmR Sensory domain
MRDHLVHFYEPGSEFNSNIASFIADALYEGEVALVIAPVERLNGVHNALEERGIDCREAIKRGRVEFLEASEMLDKFMYAGRPDPAAFERTVGEKVREMLSRRQATTLRAYGEMVGVLWVDGNDTGAVELENLWNELLADLPVSLYCGYPMESFDAPVWTDTMEDVLAAHTHAIPENITARSA